MKNKSVIIVGGGVIGLCCAYYLIKENYEVTIIDDGDITGGTSFGNAGYVPPVTLCRSHRHILLVKH